MAQTKSLDYIYIYIWDATIIYIHSISNLKPIQHLLLGEKPQNHLLDPPSDLAVFYLNAFFDREVRRISGHPGLHQVIHMGSTHHRCSRVPAGRFDKFPLVRMPRWKPRAKGRKMGRKLRKAYGCELEGQVSCGLCHHRSHSCQKSDRSLSCPA